jgi:hypothetical protein
MNSKESVQLFWTSDVSYTSMLALSSQSKVLEILKLCKMCSLQRIKSCDGVLLLKNWSMTNWF